MVVAVACKRDFLNNLGGEMTGKSCTRDAAIQLSFETTLLQKHTRLASVVFPILINQTYSIACVRK